MTAPADIRPPDSGTATLLRLHGLLGTQQDQIFCTPLATDCSSRAALVAEERPYYAGALCLDAVVMPGVGHDVNLHPSAPEFRAKVIAWADAVTGGGCPSG